MSKYDVIVIGSGHNGLITACYLAKANYSVCVIERRDNIGGAVCTETMFKSKRFPSGFQIDVGSSVHIMIHQTGIIEELELHHYGLDYIDMEPMMSYPVPGEKKVIHFFKDLNRTLDSIAKTAPEDVENYRDFVDFWGNINQQVLRTFMAPPNIKNIGESLAKNRIQNGSLFKNGERLNGLQQVFANYGKVVNDAFENTHLKTALIWFAAQSGPTPDHPATGNFAGWQSMLHRSGAKHPRGGSGMLTQALANCLRAHGGKIITNAAVASVIIKNKEATGVKTEEGEIFRASKVISNAHVQPTMMKLVGREYLEPSLYKKVKNVKVGNGFGMAIRCAVEELPEYTSCPDDSLIHNGMQLLAPSQDYMNQAIGSYKQNRPPDKPAVLAMTFSAIDPDMAPSGGHTLYGWAQWHPYELADGLNWDEIREKEAEKIYDVITDYAPNMKDKLIDWYIQTPLDIERKHNMPRGNVMHVEMSFDQMFMFRPLPKMSQYKTPIKNLYLSSASCHPGGGVFGAAGYNAAKVVLKDLRKKRWFGF